MAKERLYSIDPGVPFLATLSQAVLSGAIFPEISRDNGPLALAGATIYVPTQRAARALKAQFAADFGGALLLPRIAPLGALDDSETRALFDVPENLFEFGDDIPEAIGELERRMQLMRLVLGWSEAVRHAIVSVDAAGRRFTDETEALLVAATPADAFQLAGALASLIDEMIVENIPWEKLPSLNNNLHDDYWRITLDFLAIAFKAWPERLTELGKVDHASRQAKLIERDIARLRKGGGGPVIVAGSTGVQSATARLMAAVAASPQGAIVLPGLDLGLDADAFAMIGDGADADANASHPQAALRRLLHLLGKDRKAFKPLGKAAPELASRAAFVSLAMLPAGATDAWAGAQNLISSARVNAAMAGLALIEAAHEGEEALALAVALRATLEQPGRRAILVTPDRSLALRVSAELKRWNIDITDSGGVALPLTEAGVLAELALDCARAPVEPAALLALLSHPLTRLGDTRGRLAALLGPFEIGLLRGALAPDALHDPAQLIGVAKAAARARHAHPAKARIADAAFAQMQDLLERTLAALQPLAALAGRAPLSALVTAHAEVVAALTRGPADSEAEDAGFGGRSGAALRGLFATAATAAADAATLSLAEYRAFYNRLAYECVVPQAPGTQERIAILGLLEARLLPADVMLLAGLDEGVWPPQADSGPFLNRPMRAELGLTPPERRIGQTAHDFTQSLGAAEVIISRSRKRGGEPTVASRFLQRMRALASAEAWSASVARGADWLELARALDSAPEQAPVQRPNPKPDLRLRPTRLSVTQIETLRRDPYAIYAAHVLKLQALEDLGLDFSARDFGQWTHEALRLYGERYASGVLPASALDELFGFAREAFTAVAGRPDFETFRWPAMARGLKKFVAWDEARRPHLQRIDVERAGALTLDLPDATQFVLTARADRIELRLDGSLAIVDFKTGAVPPSREVLDGFSPQLSLEAAIATGGGFKGLPLGAKVSELTYVKFGGGDVDATMALGKDTDIMSLAASHVAELTRLLEDFRNPLRGYPSRPFPRFAPRFSDYTHLARVKEWSAAGGEEAGGEAAT